ncbi:DUF934 domain-containing protein [Sandarakinorhabdus sp.]|uniref:DUF934 domain-containing protein n=1 Tax=Sandarakinorhabdus sp. TaxID=1916663 RepID=UPI0033406518
MADSHLLRLRDDAVHDAAAVALVDHQQGDTAVQLAPADDARALIPHLATLHRIDIVFPKFRDGRGFSSARILREAGFTGEIRAVGDLKIDQLGFLVRAGFDAVRSDLPFDPAVVTRTLQRFAHVYMKAADGRPPVWALRGA